MEDWHKRGLHRRAIRVCFHQVGHAVPPFAHDGQIGQGVHGVVALTLERSEQVPGGVVEENPVIADSGVTQRLSQLGPYVAMTPLVFIALARFEGHPERNRLHCGLPFLGVEPVESRFLPYDYNSPTDNMTIRSQDQPIAKPNRIIEARWTQENAR